MSTLHRHATPAGPQGPVGVFDSGVGGLSVLRHVRALLPHEDVLYFADSAFAPYGDRSEAEIAARSLAVAGFLVQQGCKALVVACNTATAAAVQRLRQTWPDMPIVGVEPGLKPAAALTRSGVVGVLATQGTVASVRFDILRSQVASATGVRFVARACVGLADQIEKGELQSPATAALLHRYLLPLIEAGADTLVLGCTHYPFALPLLEELLANLTREQVHIVDTGEPVARQLARLVVERGLGNQSGGALAGFTTGAPGTLTNAFERLLGIAPPVAQLNAA